MKLRLQNPVNDRLYARNKDSPVANEFFDLFRYAKDIFRNATAQQTNVSETEGHVGHIMDAGTVIGRKGIEVSMALSTANMSWNETTTFTHDIGSYSQIAWLL